MGITQESYPKKMQVLFYFFSFAFLCCHAEASFTLGDFLNADPEIQTQKPSLIIPFSLVGKEIAIKEERYQIRSFVFEANPLDDPAVNELTFLQFVKDNDLRGILAVEDKPRIPPVSFRASLYPTYSVFNTLEKAGTWFHYMIVLRKVKDVTPQ